LASPTKASFEQLQSWLSHNKKAGGCLVGCVAIMAQNPGFFKKPGF